jgi:hypothetical protein
MLVSLTLTIATFFVPTKIAKTRLVLMKSLSPDKLSPFLLDDDPILATPFVNRDLINALKKNYVGRRTFTQRFVTTLIAVTQTPSGSMLLALYIGIVLFTYSFLFPTHNLLQAISALTLYSSVHMFLDKLRETDRRKSRLILPWISVRGLGLSLKNPLSHLYIKPSYRYQKFIQLACFCALTKYLGATQYDSLNATSEKDSTYYVDWLRQDREVRLASKMLALPAIIYCQGMLATTWIAHLSVENTLAKQFPLVIACTAFTWALVSIRFQQLRSSKFKALINSSKLVLNHLPVVFEFEAKNSPNLRDSRTLGAQREMRRIVAFDYSANMYNGTKVSSFIIASALFAALTFLQIIK